MRLAASNIGWPEAMDARVLRAMADAGFSGLELAPTRVFPERPYDHLDGIARYAAGLRREYGLTVCSMQSIWYGVSLSIAESAENRAFLLDYTEKAARFAAAAGCPNLVFGCPRNRATRTEADAPVIEAFWAECARRAEPLGVVVALEANPPIYHTNFINTTRQALDLIERVDHPALRLNLDLGTVIENGESLDWIAREGGLIHHVHISEPGLAPIRERPAHAELRRQLEAVGYDGCVSIEMGAREDGILDAIELVKREFLK